MRVLASDVISESSHVAAHFTSLYFTLLQSVVVGPISDRAQIGWIQKFIFYCSLLNSPDEQVRVRPPSDVRLFSSGTPSNYQCLGSSRVPIIRTL